MPKHKPDYEEINRMEHELFPEWFPKEEKPTPPPTPPPPLKPTSLMHKRQIEKALHYGVTVGSAYSLSASALKGASLHGSPGATRLRTMKRQVVLPWEPPRS